MLQVAKALQRQPSSPAAHDAVSAGPSDSTLLRPAGSKYVCRHRDYLPQRPPWRLSKAPLGSVRARERVHKGVILDREITSHKHELS